MEKIRSIRSSQLVLLRESDQRARKSRRTASEFDEAFKLLQVAKAKIPYQTMEAVNIKLVGQKIDWRLLPMFSIWILVQYMDRFMFQYAITDHLRRDLGLRDDEVSNVFLIHHTASAVGAAIIAIPLLRFPPALVLGASVLLWSAAIGCLAATKSYSTIAACRALSGFFGAATIPCLTLVVSSWYRKAHQSIRFCVCLCGVGLSQLFGPCLSYAFSQIRSASLANWRIQFIFVAGFGLAMGILMFLALPSNPVSSAGRFLSTHEASALLEYLSVNRTTVKNTTFALTHLKATVLDPQTYLLSLIAASIASTSALTPVMNNTILSSPSGKSGTTTAYLLTTSIFPTFFTVVVGFLLQYTPWTRVSSIIVSMLIASIGATLLSCAGGTLSQEMLSSSDISISAYFVTSLGLVTATGTALTLSYAAANIAGATKRVVSFCLVAAAFSIGDIFATLAKRSHRVALPQPFLQPLGFICLGTALLSIIFTLLLWIWYVYANWTKQKRQQGSLNHGGICENGHYRHSHHRYRQAPGRLEYTQNVRQDHCRSRRRRNNVQGDEWVNRTDSEDSKFFYCY